MTQSKLGRTGPALEMRNRFGLVMAVLMFVCLFTTVSWGQAALGTIVGTVKDPTGAILRDASITVTNMETNVSAHTKTTEAGDFTVPYLNPATYKVTVEVQGFAKAELTGIVLVLGQITRADIILMPGSDMQTITVAASIASSELDTDSAAVGQVISERQIMDLPMENRSFGNLLLLAPGATTTIVNYPTGNVQPAATLDIGGARGTSNGYLVDGMTNTDPWMDQPQINISLDAIQEFKEQSSVYGAQYGGSAVQINASIKSGTNQYHGTMYEFNRNDAFDAYQYNFSGQTEQKAKLRQNQWGYSFGGPVVFPKLYNGHDKTFFFANFEQYLNNAGGPSENIAPTASELAGTVNTSETINGQTVFIPIVNPATGVAFAPDQSGNVTIPNTLWSRMAAVTLKGGPGMYFVKETGAYAGAFNSLTYFSNNDIANQQTYRIDQKLWSKDNLAARFSLTNNSAGNVGSVAAQSGSSGTNSQSWNVIETHTFSPNLVNMARVGWIQYFSGSVTNAAPAADMAALGFQNTFPLAGAVYPNIAITGLSCCGGPLGGTTYFITNTWNGEDSLTWIHGRHAMSAGFLAVMHNAVEDGSSNIQGSYNFDGSKTFSTQGLTPAQAASAHPNVANSWADFLLGWSDSSQITIPTGYSQIHPINPNLYIDVHKLAGFVNDDFKVRPNLTVNIGLRYDFQSNPTEEHHRQFWRDLSNPQGALCSTDATMVSTLGSPYFHVCKRSTPKMPFAPRIGFAFRPFSDDKTVVRGGYGIFFDQYSLYEFASGNIAPYIGTFNANGYNTDNLYPSQALPVVTPAQLGSLYNLEPPTMHDPYMEEWSLSVERALLKDTKLTVNYVGSEGQHLETRLASNQPTSYIPENPGPAYPFQNFGTYGQDGSPFSPGYVLEGGFPGASNYNSLQVSMDRRTKNMALLVAYTWSSAMDDVSSSGGAGMEYKEWSGPMDAHNVHRDYAKSAFDVNQRLVTSIVYSLPFGRGQEFGRSMNRGLDAVVGGWQVNGIVTLQSGVPFNTYCTDIGSALQAFDQRCNKVGNPFPAGFHKSPSMYVSPAAYTQPAQGVLGTEHRDDLRSYGINNADASLFKNFNLLGDGRVKFQFRAEGFNVLNHPQFGGPDQQWPDASFGVITGTFHNMRELQFAGKIIF